MAKLFGQRSSTAWAGLTGEHTDKYSAVPSLLQLLLAATSSLQEDVLPLLQYWLSSRVKKVLMLCRYLANHFFSREMKYSMKLAKSWKQSPLLCSIFRLFIGFWVKIWHRNKAACSESNSVQSSRSKSTTCSRKGRLLRFESISTATSDGGTQKLGNNHCIFFLYHFHTFLYTPVTLNPKPWPLNPSALQFCN